MNIKDLQQKLLGERKALLDVLESGDQASAVVELDQSKVGRLSRMDALQAQAMSQATNQRRDIHIKQIEAALARIDADEYGDCLRCGEEIAESRLKLNPAVTLCIDCANSSEMN